MEVKEAVTIARQFIATFFDDEKVSNLAVEEIEFDDSANEWRVTFGFSRSWDEPRNSLSAMLPVNTYLRRSYKIVRISDKDGKVLSVKDRQLQP